MHCPQTIRAILAPGERLTEPPSKDTVATVTGKEVRWGPPRPVCGPSVAWRVCGRGKALNMTLRVGLHSPSGPSCTGSSAIWRARGSLPEAGPTAGAERRFLHGPTIEREGLSPQSQSPAGFYLRTQVPAARLFPVTVPAPHGQALLWVLLAPSFPPVLQASGRAPCTKRNSKHMF